MRRKPPANPWPAVREREDRLIRERDEARSERDRLRDRVDSLERGRVVLRIPAQSFARESFRDARARAKALLDLGVVCGVEFP